MFDFMIVLLAIVGVFALAAFAADVPKNRHQLAEALNAWHGRLQDEDEWWHELAISMGGRPTWQRHREFFGRNVIVDAVTWQWHKHQRGLFLMRVAAFHWLDRKTA